MKFIFSALYRVTQKVFILLCTLQFGHLLWLDKYLNDFQVLPGFYEHVTCYKLNCFNDTVSQISQVSNFSAVHNVLDPLTPNGHYSGSSAPLTSGRCILNIYSTNIRTENFKHAAQSPIFSLQNAVYFIMLPFFVPVLFTF
jgi:hypothetical protein